MRLTQETIRSKGFSIRMAEDLKRSYPEEKTFSRTKVGAKSLKDATFKITEENNRFSVTKEEVMQAIARGDSKQLRFISKYFYRTSGIYARLCRYMAYLYRYDWWVIPYLNQGKESYIQKAAQHPNVPLKKFFDALNFLDEFGVKRFCGDTALKVIKEGAFYGVILPCVSETETTIQVQELDANYCRSRFQQGGKPIIEFNMQYFDSAFPNSEMRERILNMLPHDFRRGYKLYKEGKLYDPADFTSYGGWYVLDPESTVCFRFDEDCIPLLVSVIPSILDLDEAKELERKRAIQRLLKIVIQKMPIDKNGELIFDIEEAAALHNNAVQMLQRAVGMDVLTTYADVVVADMSDKATVAQQDDIGRAKQNVFDESGVSSLQFNSEGNIALQNSIKNDEASMYSLIQQFEDFLNLLLLPFNHQNKYCYRAQILGTTIYNYQELSKIYKDQAQMGYSKMLPQIALGQSQSSILANSYWENDILDLVNVFIPPMTSNTMNADALQSMKDNSKESKIKSRGNDGAGRPEKPDSEKTDKTIANRESM